MGIILGLIVGFVGYFVVRYGMGGIYTVEQNERAVKTSFGRADRLGERTNLDDPISDCLTEEQRTRYLWPQLKVIMPGGPYFKMPWERVYKVPIAISTASIAYDPESKSANQSGTVLDAVTKDQLNVGLTGQIRYLVSERNLYPFVFGVKRPIAHVMGFFVSILRERIANFEAPVETPLIPALPAGTEAAEVLPISESLKPLEGAGVHGISINDLRKNLRDLNHHIEEECKSSASRYGIVLDAALITGIDPPHEVESALAAINTAYNQVSSEISLAHAGADQKIVQSKRAVEIETLKAQAEVEPLNWMAAQLHELKKMGPNALTAYIRNVRLQLLANARHTILEIKK